MPGDDDTGQAMAQPGQFSDDDRKARDELDEVLSRANPNPERKGCPPRQTLVELAARARAVGDPAYRHLSNCSPCYREFRALQDNPTVRNATSLATSRVRLIAVAAVAVLAVGLAGTWFAFNRAPAPGLPVAVTQPPAAELRAELDLRKFVVMRSEQSAEPAPPVLLPVGLVDLTLLLPVGSEPGAYDIQLLDSDLKSRAAARGDAALQNYVTTIHADRRSACRAGGRLSACDSARRGTTGGCFRRGCSDRLAKLASLIRNQQVTRSSPRAGSTFLPNIVDPDSPVVPVPRAG